MFFIISYNIIISFRQLFFYRLLTLLRRQLNHLISRKRNLILLQRRIKQFTRYPDISGSFYLISSQHPHLNTSLLQSLNGFTYFILKLIFNSSSPNNNKFIFQFLLTLFHLLFSFIKSSQSSIIPFRPFFIISLIYISLTQKQSSKSYQRILFQMLSHLRNMVTSFNIGEF